jgi:SNF2 family DNA or RNA helicase
MESSLSTSSSSTALRGVSNMLMEARSLCNHPLIGHLHAPGAESALPRHPLPAEIRLCGKLELLDRLLVKLRAGGHKVLLFSTMTSLLDLAETYLEWRGFSFLRLDGATPAAERGPLVAEFNAPGSDTFVFLLSVRAGGVGLNLQAVGARYLVPLIY